MIVCLLSDSIQGKSVLHDMWHFYFFGLPRGNKDIPIQIVNSFS